MIMPAEAFAETGPFDMSPGTLFKFRGEWALLVGYDDEPTKDFIVLTGPNAGQLKQVARGIAKGVFIKALSAGSRQSKWTPSLNWAASTPPASR